MKTKLEKGFALMGVIFMILLLSISSVFLVNLSFQEQQLMNEDLRKIRAKHVGLSALSIAEKAWEGNPSQCPDQSLSFDGFKVTVHCEMLRTAQVNKTRYFSVKLMAHVQKDQKDQKGEGGISLKMPRDLLLTSCE